MGFIYIDIFVALAINLIQCASSDHILSCNISYIEPCKGHHQICNETTQECKCIDGFVFVGDDCGLAPQLSSDLPSTNEPLPPYHHGATAPVVTIFALVLIVSGLVLVIRKYNLVDYVRQKINKRRNNEVMYEDVMIGNDDPPLSL